MAARTKTTARSIARKFRLEIAVYRAVMKHERTLWPAGGLLLLAVGYALSPIDIIPDFVPVLGYLDDIVIVPALVWLALRLIPAGVVEECRRTCATPLSRSSC